MDPVAELQGLWQAQAKLSLRPFLPKQTNHWQQLWADTRVEAVLQPISANRRLNGGLAVKDLLSEQHPLQLPPRASWIPSCSPPK